MKSLKRSLGAALLVLLGSQTAAAAPVGPPIRVVLRSCGDVQQAEVERIVRAELGAEQSAEGEAADPSFISVSCAGTHVRVEVADVVSRKTLHRDFDFGKAPAKSRARLIAIASSELVLASWSELALRPGLRVEPEGARPPPEHAQAARSRAEDTRSALAAPGEALVSDWAPIDTPPPASPRQRWLDELPPERRRFRITGLGSARGLVSTKGAMLGGGLRIADERLVRFCWALDALYETGRFSLTDREYDVDSWSLGGMVYLYGRARVVTVRAGAGLRAGLTSASVRESSPPAPSTRVLTPWGWPMLALGFSLGPRPFALELSGEAGYVAVPIAPTSQGGASLRGIWVGAQLGFSVVL